MNLKDLSSRLRPLVEDLAEAISGWATARGIDESTDVVEEPVSVPSGDFSVVYSDGSVQVNDAAGRLCAEFRYRPHTRPELVADTRLRLSDAALRELPISLDPEGF